MIAIADGGATKCDWALVENGEIVERVKMAGINPFSVPEEQIRSVVKEEFMPVASRYDITHIWFYGAGCGMAGETVKRVLTDFFPSTKIVVGSDIDGAAMACCADGEGIVCILGTGVSSMQVEGGKCTKRLPGPGYILGDEGSSAVLGRRLVGDCLKNQLPEAIRDEFLAEYKLTQEIILEKVYRQPLANRFLASLTPFLSKHRDVPEVHKLLVESFTDFFIRNVKQYRRPWLPIHFVGSIANAFSTELKEAAESLGMELGTILQSPMEGLIRYHTDKKAKP